MSSSYATINSRALNGLDAPLVHVETHLTNGLHTFQLVGLPEKEVQEGRERVRAAIQTSGFQFPFEKKITINLSQADLPKDSGRFDLPIALGILAASGQIPKPSERFPDLEFIGELSLSGELRPIRGGLAIALAIAKKGGALVIPSLNATEAAIASNVAQGLKVYKADSLAQVAGFLQGELLLEQVNYQDSQAIDQETKESTSDFSDVKGQFAAKRALEVAAVGGHSLIMVGPPGTGKSMLAQRFAQLLPPMTDEEALDSASLLSITGQFEAKKWRKRPFRSPHHTASAVALVGGSSQAKPGEISLAHHGVLFLDELPEFDKKVLEVLREPLETHKITIARATRQAEYPANFQLISAMNPCPCGYAGQPRCQCSKSLIQKYQAKISGPILDRIDLQIEVGSLTADELMMAPIGESTQAIAQRVHEARLFSLKRQGKSNSQLTVKEVNEYCVTDESAQKLLQNAIEKLGWSARAYHRVLKVARSIADLKQLDVINSSCITEAIQYRRVLKDSN
jgi:magnesium chelatase family protein